MPDVKLKKKEQEKMKKEEMLSEDNAKLIGDQNQERPNDID